LKNNAGFVIVTAVIFICMSAVCVYSGTDVAITTARDNNAFAFDIFSSLCASEAEKNVFISPYSISCALAMAYDGAENVTASQTAKTMHFPSDKKTLRTGFLELLKLLNAKDKPYELVTANSLWPQKDYGFSGDFIGGIEKYYGGKAEEVSYDTDKTAAIYRINSWTSENTKGKIPEIVGPDNVDELTRMILVNAIYFKGSWMVKFDTKKTGKADFYVNKDTKKKTPMMNASITAGYAELDGVKILEMQYAGDDISMITVLPAERDTAILEKILSYPVFKKWLAAMSMQKVDISFPKFKIRSYYPLKKTFQELGMKDAFLETLADFSGMTGKKDLYITEVIHSGYVDVNEEGAEAAAATAVVMGTKSIEMNAQFIADHPFIFFIYDRTADTILFMGRINEPKTEGEK
jgi:serpin B